MSNTRISYHHLAILFIIFTTFAVDAKSFVDYLPKRAVVLDGVNEMQMQKKLLNLDRHHIEGIWSLTESGGLIAIIRSNAFPNQNQLEGSGYLMILLQSPNRALLPGTILGRIQSTAQRGEYAAKMYGSCIGNRPCMPKKFIFKIDSTDDNLVFEKQKSTFSVNLWRFLPYLWRNVVHRNEVNTPHHGCTRVFPAPTMPIQPIYL